MPVRQSTVSSPSTMVKLLLLTSAAAVVVGGMWLWSLCSDGNSTPPRLDLEEWWGHEELKGKQDESIRPFKISFSPEMIKDLRQRLKNHRKWTPPLKGIGFEYGFNTNQLDSWLQYWEQKYNFTQREEFLNQFPQFKTNIQGLDIFFIRVKPKVPAGVQILPIILMHGWPGSVREFYEAIPLLTKHTPGYDFAFEVIVPSLPGFGFSGAAVRPGLGPAQIAVVFRNLMQRLGFKRYYIQGGDWGGAIASHMTGLFPNEVLGHHNNGLLVQTSCGTLKTLIGAYFPSLVVDPELADRMYPLSSFIAYMLEESGYFHLQATKPDTVGVALSDSPAGLLAYILEKFSTWTRSEHRTLKDGGLEFRFTKDHLIDNLMLYWSTYSITTSMRLYSEFASRKNRALNLDNYKTSVPTWTIQAKHELVYQPPSVLRTKFTNLIGTTVLDDGGHFLAFELPEIFAEDVFKAVKAIREWHASRDKTEL